MTLALGLQVLLAAVVLFAVFAYASGWLDPMSAAEPDEAAERLPADLQAADVDALVLPMAVRGYRMAEVDAALDRLAATLADREDQLRETAAELARLRAERVLVPAEPGPGLLFEPLAGPTPVASPVDLTKDGVSFPG